MSANTPSTSKPPNSPLQGASRVFVLTPDMLKKLGLSDQLKQIQSKIKPENTVQLVTNSKTSSAGLKPKLIIPSDKVRIISKKKTPDNETKKVNSDINPQSLQESKKMDKTGVDKEKEKKKPITIPTNMRRYHGKVKGHQQIIPGDQKGAEITGNPPQGAKEFKQADKNITTKGEKLMSETVEIVELMLSKENNDSMTVDASQKNEIPETIDVKRSRTVTPVSAKSMETSDKSSYESPATMKDSEKVLLVEAIKGNDHLTETQDIKSTKSSTESFKISRSPVKALMNKSTGKFPMSAAEKKNFQESPVPQKNTLKISNDSLHLQDRKSINESTKKEPDSLKSSEIQQIPEGKSPEAPKNPEFQPRVAKIRSFKPKLTIIRKLNREVQGDNKIPTVISEQNDNELTSNPLLSINPELPKSNINTSPSKLVKSPDKSITNVKTPQKFQATPQNEKNGFDASKSQGKNSPSDINEKIEVQALETESSTPKPLNNLDVLMAAVDINLKNENSKIYNRIPHEKIISTDKISPTVALSLTKEPDKLLAISKNPVKTPEKTKVIDGNGPKESPNPKSRKRSLKVDMGNTKPQKIPRRSNSLKQENPTSTKAEKRSPKVTSSPLRTSRRQLKPKIFEDCIMETSKPRKILENHTDAIVNLLISNPTSQQHKSSSPSTKADSSKELVIDNFRAESLDIGEKDLKQMDEAKTAVQSLQPSIFTEKHNERINKSVTNSSSVTLKDLTPTPERSIPGELITTKKKDDLSCHSENSRSEGTVSKLSESSMSLEKAEITMSSHKLGEHFNGLDSPEKSIKLCKSVIIDDGDMCVPSPFSILSENFPEAATKKRKRIVTKISKRRASLKGKTTEFAEKNAQKGINSQEIATQLSENASQSNIADEDQIAGARIDEGASDLLLKSAEKNGSTKIVESKLAVKPPSRRRSRVSEQAPDIDNAMKNIKAKAQTPSRRKSRGVAVNEEQIQKKRRQEVTTGVDEPHDCEAEENPVETPPVTCKETISEKNQLKLNNMPEVPDCESSLEIHERPEESLDHERIPILVPADLENSSRFPLSGLGHSDDPIPSKTPDNSAVELPNPSPVPEDLPKQRSRKKRQSIKSPTPSDLESQPEILAPEPSKEIPTPLPKRRGRKKKSELEKQLPPPGITLAVPELPQDSETLLQDSETRHRKPLSRPDETDGKGLSESDQEPTSPPPQSRRGRGRRKRGRGRGRGRGRSSLPVDRDYTPRVMPSGQPTDTSPSGEHALSTSPLPSGEALLSPKDPEKMITCGKCQEAVTASGWSRHNFIQHNNMGWKSTDPEPDFSDIKSLTRLLAQTKKRKPVLNCETCSIVKKSVAGFISHITFCGKTEVEKQSLMWTCPICRVILMPSSQEYHERVHRDQGIILNKKKKDIGKEMVVDVDTSRVKRKAAERAATRISEFTELVKAADDPAPKKIKLATKMKEFILQPKVTKKIPGVWKAMWTRAINHNEKAYCREPHCDFSSPTLQGICDHYRTCNFTPRTTFACKICQLSCEKKSEVVGHIKEAHSSEVNVDDSDYNASEMSDEDDEVDPNEEAMMVEDGEIKRKRGASSRAPVRPKAKFLENYMHIRNLAKNITFAPALKWTIEFQTKYYGLRLFEELKVNRFEMIDDPEEYLPKLKMSLSMTTLRLKQENVKEENWKRWDRFAGDVVQSVPTFFTGGPIWGLAWMPIPPTLYDKKPNQFVAVSTHKSMEDYFEVGKSYCGKNSIQIWNLGPLANDSTPPKTPGLSYVVGHEGGTIWCLEWCPSGGYDERGERMGLLAAAMSSGLVHIYSMPFPEAVGGEGKYFKTDPAMILHANDQIAATSQCMTLNWSKTSNHDTLAAGFANGYVALWDLTTKSPLMRRKESSTIHLNPFRHFYAHGHAVMFVTIVPLEEKRYLLTAGMDRWSKMWDLEDISLPFWFLKKGVAVNGTWLVNWPTFITSYDDVLGLAHTQAYLAPIREGATRVLPILPTNSPAYGIASSDWANGICEGTGAGEIVAIFPPQMLYLKEIDKISRTRWLVSNVKVIDFMEEKEGKEYQYKPNTYEECQERFGVAFCDDLENTRGAAWMLQHDKKGFLTSETMHQVPVEQYPIAAINRISWNPNGWSYSWIAVGYRNGLVRILNLRRMNKNSITTNLLAEHAAAMTRTEKEVQSS